MANRTGAQVVVDALANAGVEVIFGYPGGAIMPVYDALIESPLTHILTRHEQGATHAADGFARATGRMGVCLVTSGPGASNLVTGLCTAQMDSSPILCIAGQVPCQLIGTDGFQEADVPGMMSTITKQVYQVKSVQSLPDVMAEAIYLTTSGRPGPVVIDIPKDVLVARTLRKATGVPPIEGYVPDPPLDEETLRSAHEMLKAARKPVCIVGGGCALSGATEAFRQWCQVTQVPAITTLMGIGSADPNYPGLLGMPGMHGLRCANMAISEADLLIAMGMRFDDRVTGKLQEFAPHARIVHIDIDEAEIGKLVAVDIRIHCDLKKTLRAWNALLEEDPITPFESWRDEAVEIGTGVSATAATGEGAVPPTDLLDAVLATVGSDCIVTTDVGQHQMWTAQRIRPSRPERFITSGGAGTMGFGMPSAIGAQFGCRDKRVLAVVGDGGFQMTMAELATVARCKLPIKILIMDNKYLGMVRQWQELFFDKRYSGVDLSDNPDFAAIARVYGIEAFTLETSARMKETIDAWWHCSGPALLHAVCRLEENVFPMVPAGAGLADMMESV